MLKSPAQKTAQTSARGWHELAGGTRKFVKMHGLRNHFVIVDGRGEPYRPSASETTRICDPETGVGADQLIVAEPPSQAAASAGTAAFMRILNVDGWESEACGNALRCLAWLLMGETGARDVIIETAAGLRRCRATGAMRVEADMGAARLGWRDIPLSREMDTAHLGLANGPLRDPAASSMGNPHCTFFVDDLDAVDVARWAPAIQCDPLLPEQANVGVAQMLNAETIALSVWERPGILTAACGTGACAAAVAAVRRGYSDAKRFRVVMRGGTVEITLADDGTVRMEGDVAVSFAGVLP
ncbi:MAG TPA: diaminopimelate epimerase [Aestuariivirgaceae bacterium]|nr:diaminopimelate epimerase [Aestuariivirgaceae bacterium]